MASYTVTPSETIPVDLYWYDGGVVTDGTVTASLKEVDTTGWFMDWDDLTFKESGHGTLLKALTNLGAGHYGVAAGLTLTDVTMNAGTNLLHMDFAGTAPLKADAVAQDVFSITGEPISVPAIADSFDVWDQANADLANTMGQVVIYTPTGESAVQIKAVFDIDAREVLAADGFPVQVHVPMLTMRDADLPVGTDPLRGDTMTVGGVAYTVVNQPRSDGRGGWELDLSL